MKRIYTFTLSSDEYPSSGRRLFNDLRLIAYMLYSEIFNYDGENTDMLVINDKIQYNYLNERIIDLGYCFDSDLYDDGYTFYEPFIVGNRTFCFTVNDDKIDRSIIMEQLEYVLKLLKLNYNIMVDSVVYDAKDINDERNREGAIRSIYDRFGYKCGLKSGLIAMIMRCSSSKKRTRKVRKKCCYF